MPTIYLKTVINAPINRVFDLCRSIDLHMATTSHTGERAVAGCTSGLIGLHEQVTWQARHFGITQKLTSKITAFNSPAFFADEMVSGAFKAFRHEHRFSQQHGQTIMIDEFCFTAPLGVLGKLFSLLVLKRYMTRLLITRNQIIKNVAEGNNWQLYLPSAGKS